MSKKRKQVGRKRKFDRIRLFPNKPISELLEARLSIEKHIPCNFCRISYIDSMIEEFNKLIDIKEQRVAIVDATGVDMSKFYNAMMQMRSSNF